MHFQQQQLPPLVPIKKKRDTQSSYTPQIDEKSKNMQSTQPKTQQRQNVQFKQEMRKPQTNQLNRNSSARQKQQPKTPKQVQQKKMQSFSQKFKNIQEKQANKQNKSTNQKSQQQKKQQNQKSKFLIAQMLNKISVKNISQQLYPITNQTIQTVIYQMQQQIRAYKTQAQKKQNTLITNPNNQHLKLQIANLQKSINHCVTIKQLYHEKINFRNKVAILEGKIIELRAENRDLKIKVTRGIQKIQNHMHSLPCQKEKELKEELNKSTEELRRQKEMRMSLENNIQDIIMNFKRLYEEADTARLIVTKKLKEVEDRERKINEAKLQALMDGEQQNSNSIKRSPKLDLMEEKRSPKPPAMYPQEPQNATQRYRQRPERQPREQRDKQRQRERQKDRDRQKTQRQYQKGSSQIKQKQQRKPMGFEQSIRKMRGNQSMFSKVYNRG